jgi:hypothetical protein
MNAEAREFACKVGEEPAGPAAATTVGADDAGGQRGV